MEEVCARHGIPLAAAALAFSVRDPRVASTIVGVSAPGRVQQLVEFGDTVVPDAVWDEFGIPPVASGAPPTS
jgi:D-threo-aldose 1-dehydrogenase